MHTAVIKFDPLADSIGTAAQDHDLAVVGDRYQVFGIVGGKVIGRIFHPTDRHRLPGFGGTQGDTTGADIFFREIEQLGQVAIGKAVLFGLEEKVVRRDPAFVGQQRFFQLYQFLHLLDEPGLDVGQLIQFLDFGAFAQGFVHDELAFAGGGSDYAQEFIQGQFVEVLGEPEPVTVDFQAADGFLEGLFIILADAHDFAHGLHLGAELVFQAGEFFKGPAGEFNHHIVAGRGVLFKRSVPPVRDFIHGQAPGQQGGDHGDGKTGGLGSQG